MPVRLVGDASGRDFLALTKRDSKTGFDESAGGCLHIGLINNMPDGALEATERQFLTLLDSAADGVAVRLSLYALPDIPRTESGLLRIARLYSGIEALWDSHLDGLIVTGAEPQATKLTDEPYWGSLKKVLDWAEHGTHSTVLSCLAAHAAVQHMDAIGRRRLSNKRFGVFESVRASDHQLMAGIPSALRIPHSRWNDVAAKDLADCGYSFLTRAKDGGVDAFVKKQKSLFVFFQGHPEYESDTLLIEYRRDVGRYLTGERETYPEMPEGYFDNNTVDVLTTLRQRALSNLNNDVLSDFPTAQAGKRIANTWSPLAARVYGNWLKYLCEQREVPVKAGTIQQAASLRAKHWVEPSLSAPQGPANGGPQNRIRRSPETV
jgi:homoserine O-succinyltransferase